MAEEWGIMHWVIGVLNMRLCVAVVLAVVAIVCSHSSAWAENAVKPEVLFHCGVNLTNWLQAGSARQIQFTKYTKQDLANIKSLGCDVIRLPINLHFMTNGAPNYTIDPLFFYFLDQIVGWSEELKIHLILDNHTFDVAANTDPNVDKVLIPVWSQMAEHYKGRSTYIYYEILNEPHGIDDARWSEIQRQVINAIRQIDGTHTIVVTGAGWGSYNNLKALGVCRDDNLIYSFHFYDPFMFTHQGASWTNPSMVPLAGVPFPYGAGPMPACPASLKGTWIESSLNTYSNDGTEAHVKQLIDIAADFQNTRHVPVFCGEFGAYIPNSKPEHRVHWYELVRTYFQAKGIPWTTWDYQGGFGLFQAGTNELFEHDLNVPLVEALGLTAPAQTPYVLTPDRTGFSLYADYAGPGVLNSAGVSQGTLDYYCTTAPAEGLYCISCAGLARYDAIVFDFRPNKDMSLLAQKGSALEFWVRGGVPGAKLEVRFVDTKTSDPQDHPWRMGATLDEKQTTWDSQWHRVQIPLKDFVDRGSWDNGWFNPQGAFNWAAVDRFEIVAEYHDLTGMQFWFDTLRVTDPVGVR
jgi:endoglucanase